MSNIAFASIAANINAIAGDMHDEVKAAVNANGAASFSVNVEFSKQNGKLSQNVMIQVLNQDGKIIHEDGVDNFVHNSDKRLFQDFCLPLLAAMNRDNAENRKALSSVLDAVLNGGNDERRGLFYISCVDGERNVIIN